MRRTALESKRKQERLARTRKRNKILQDRLLCQTEGGMFADITGTLKFDGLDNDIWAAINLDT
jgi:hypothetical protein